MNEDKDIVIDEPKPDSVGITETGSSILAKQNNFNSETARVLNVESWNAAIEAAAELSSKWGDKITYQRDIRKLKK